MQASIRPPIFSAIADDLRGRRDVVTEAWMRALRDHPGIESADGVPRHELADHLPMLLEDLAGRIGARSRSEEPSIEKDARSHGRHRWEQGYQIVEIFREAGLLRRVLLEEIYGLPDRIPGVTLDDARRAEMMVHRFFDELAGDSVAQYVEEQQRWQENAKGELEQRNRLLEDLNTSRLGLMRAIAHELRNSLNAQSIALALLERGDLAQNRANVVSLSRRNLTEMAGLIDQLLDYSVLVSGQGQVRLEKFHVADFMADLEAVWRLAAEAQGLKFTVRCDDGLREVVCDRGRLKQIAGNLISNAIKYQTNTTDGAVDVELVEAGADEWSLVVRDRGIGIASEDLDKLFKEFSRIQPQAEIPGTGLGLAITQRLAELLEGRIEVTSEVGRGSCFCVTLPRVCAEK